MLINPPECSRSLSDDKFVFGRRPRPTGVRAASGGPAGIVKQPPGANPLTINAAIFFPAAKGKRILAKTASISRTLPFFSVEYLHFLSMIILNHV